MLNCGVVYQLSHAMVEGGGGDRVLLKWTHDSSDEIWRLYHTLLVFHCQCEHWTIFIKIFKCFLMSSYSISTNIVSLYVDMWVFIYQWKTTFEFSHKRFKIMQHCHVVTGWRLQGVRVLHTGGFQSIRRSQNEDISLSSPFRWPPEQDDVTSDDNTLTPSNLSGEVQQAGDTKPTKPSLAVTKTPSLQSFSDLVNPPDERFKEGKRKGTKSSRFNICFI